MVLGFDPRKRREFILRGPVIKMAFVLAAPFMIQNLVNISYNIVDAIWLNMLGTRFFAAVRGVWPLIFFFNSFGIGLTSAGIAFISQHVGAGNWEEANRNAGKLLGFALSFSLAVSALGILTTPAILAFMGIPEEIYPLAVTYIRVIFAGFVFTVLGMVFYLTMSGVGDTVTPMILGVIASATNMILDPLLIFGWFGFPRLEVLGAAVATVTARAIPSIVGATLLFRGFRSIKIRPRDLVYDIPWLKRLLKVGLPLAANMSSSALGFNFLMAIVYRLGTVAVAAYGLAITVVDLVTAFIWGFRDAIAIMVGQNLGAGLFERAEEIVRKVTAIILLATTVGTALLMVFGQDLVVFFTKDPAVVRETTNFVIIFSPSLPYLALFFIGMAVARGSGQTLFMMIAGIVRLWGIRVLFSYVLALAIGMGTYGVWLAMSLGNIVAGSMAMMWILSGRWKKRVIEAPPPPVEKEIPEPVTTNGD